MIRFIDLTNQIDEGKKFAFFDTVTMQFFSTGNGWCVWETIKDFEIDYLSLFTPQSIKRYLDVIPDEWE